MIRIVRFCRCWRLSSRSTSAHGGKRLLRAQSREGVAAKAWHPLQKSAVESDGGCLFFFPFEVAYEMQQSTAINAS